MKGVIVAEKPKKKVLKEVMFDADELEEEIALHIPEPELLQESKKMSKEAFLKSVGLDHRPNSIRAIEAWEKYNKG